jgi:hypothetical protein
MFTAKVIILEVLENIPLGINKRLSRISSCINEIFDKAAPDYEDALRKSGYENKLEYNPDESECGSPRPKRKRSRKIIYFNPPYSRDVKTNVGRQFLQIMDKKFPPENPLSKIFNRKCENEL